MSKPRSKNTPLSFDERKNIFKYIQQGLTLSKYTDSGRFWKSMLKLVTNAEFDVEKWRVNLSKMVERFGPRARMEDYLKLMSEVYNWRNSLKIDLIDE